MYPSIIIDLKKFRKNVQVLRDQCHKRDVKMMAVTKVFCADHKLVKILNEEKVDYIADSRIQNLKEISTDIPKVLLRIPSHGEIEDVIQYSDISLNSELSTIELLNSESHKYGTKHGIILMIDLGDLREGIFDENEVYNVVKRVLELPHIELRGIGTNLTCYGGVIPSIDNMNQLLKYKQNIEEKFDISLEIVSGGNSSSIDMLLEDKIPSGINNLRLGESLVLGRETAYGNYIDGTYNDVFCLEADIIELKVKPTVPIGQIGMDAFGKVPTFEDKGNRLRAILAVGKQDVDHRELIPFDTIKPIGSSSDHIIVDATEGHNIYEVGGMMLFRLTYSSILSLMTSKYVTRYYDE
ncbi:ornithine racemase Orr [Candidatus Xianfuyuplasma coldseepsis]|uniref:Alanine/ornithine racemase family PLP-dependent enzyme n=1 Tax=Candidatus Xianfuyuplasma coldseepsis TaxID=2782163 RepID=A0A7L7KR53_9MOLU|nr:ornithine racemase Orr [Xianfuyuplasma coldseepsis]QMS85167.1 alanine/ornithine racemase family PLP-dependent enzyme [Xianfuyuplasma coldseepsis]